MEIGMEQISSMTGVAATDLVSLTTLDLANIRPQKLPDGLSRLTNLQELHISLERDDQGRYDLPSFLSRMTALTKISVVRVAFGTIPPIILKCTQLKELVLENCGLTDLPQGIGALTQLERLDISHNMISELPYAISNLVALKEIDIAFNRLSFKKTEVGRGDPSRNMTMSFYGELKKTSAAIPVLPPNFDPKNIKLAIPPGLCLRPSLDIKLIGNLDIPNNRAKRIEAAMRSKTNPVKKSLKVLASIQSIPDVDPFAIKEYESFGCDSLTVQHQADGVSNRDLDYIIRRVAMNEFSTYMEHPLIHDRLDALWHNRSTSKHFALTTTEDLPSKSKPWTYMVFWTKTYLTVLLPRFMASLKGRFSLSLIGYIAYLVLLGYYVQQMTTIRGIPTYVIPGMLQKEFTATSVDTMDKFWEYVKNDFAKKLYFGPYNVGEISPEDSYVKPKQFFRTIGLSRVRQLRVKSKPCDKITYVERDEDDTEPIQYCAGKYEESDEETNPFGPENFFKYSSTKVLFATETKSPSGIWYGPKGYMIYFSGDPIRDLSIITSLEEAVFIDTQTRFVAVEFFVSLDNLRSYAYVSLFFEFLPTGLVNTWTDVVLMPNLWVFKSSELPDLYNGLFLAWFISCFLYQLQRAVLMRKRDYLDGWFWFDLLLCLLYAALIYLEVVTTRLVERKSYQVEDIFQDLNGAAAAVDIKMNILGVTVFLSFMRLLLYTGLLPFMGLMQTIVRYMIKDVAKFVLFLSVFLIAFSLHFMLAYGDQNEKYKDFESSLITSIESMFGNFELDDFTSNSSTLSGADGILFLLVTSIMLLNFLIAMLSSTYISVMEKAENERKRLFIETVYFLKDTDLPPPLNIISILANLSKQSAKERIKIWKNFMDLEAFKYNMVILLPYPKTLSVWKYKEGGWLSPEGFVDLLVIFFVWLNALITTLLVSPLLYLVRRFAPSKLDLTEKMVLLTTYLSFLLVWASTLLLWMLGHWSHQMYDFIWLHIQAWGEKNEPRASQNSALSVSFSDPDIHLVEQAKHSRIESAFSFSMDDTMAQSTISTFSFTDYLCVAQPSLSGKPSLKHVLPALQDRTLFSVSLLHGDACIGTITKEISDSDRRRSHPSCVSVKMSTGQLAVGESFMGKVPDLKKAVGMTYVVQISHENGTVTFYHGRNQITQTLSWDASMGICPYIELQSPYSAVLVRIANKSSSEVQRLLRGPERVACHSSHVFATKEPFLVSSHRLTDDSTVIMEKAVPCTSKLIHTTAFESLLIGTSRRLVFGFSYTPTDNQTVLGKTPHTMGLVVDYATNQLIMSDYLKGNLLETVEFNFGENIDLERGKFSIVLDFVEQYCSILFRNKEITKLRRKLIVDPQTVVYFGVTVNSPGQLIKATKHSEPRISRKSVI